MKKGFTLVELSIVLVIIGLLIGGILAGKSLLDSVKMKRMLTDLQQYEVAVNQFKGKFKKYPGDSKYFNPVGNENNLTTDGSGCAGAISANESLQAWPHLTQSGMLRKSYSPYSPVSCGGTHNDNYFLEIRTGPIFAKNTYQGDSILGFYVDPVSYAFNANIDPMDAVALDAKMDDGKGNSGDIGTSNDDVFVPCDQNMNTAFCYFVYKKPK